MGAMGKNESCKELARALVCAKNGVQAEAEGNTDDAVVFYRMADRLITRVLDTYDENGASNDDDIDSISTTDLELLETRGGQYRKRIEVLDNYILQRSDSKTKKEDMNGLFMSMPTESVPSAPPTQIFYRSFWLMRIMEKSMRTGAYITPRLYITPQVWLESGVDITGLKHKYTGCNTILIHIQKLSQFKVEDINTINSELDAFLGVLRAVQSDLASKMTFIAKPLAEGKEGKDMSRQKVVNKTMVRLKNKIFKEQLQADTQTKYISILSKLLKESLILEEWFDHFVGEEGSVAAEIASKLNKIGDFYFSVLCAFMVRDFNQLVKRYMKKATIRMLQP